MVEFIKTTPAYVNRRKPTDLDDDIVLGKTMVMMRDELRTVLDIEIQSVLGDKWRTIQSFLRASESNKEYNATKAKYTKIALLGVRAYVAKSILVSKSEAEAMRQDKEAMKHFMEQEKIAEKKENEERVSMALEQAHTLKIMDANYETTFTAAKKEKEDVCLEHYNKGKSTNNDFLTNFEKRNEAMKVLKQKLQDNDVSVDSTTNSEGKIASTLKDFKVAEGQVNQIMKMREPESIKLVSVATSKLTSNAPAKGRTRFRITFS